jgi:acyl carrier protein phosphodiesterase
MNYLAHTFLSFSQEPLVYGQFIADDIKGKQWMEHNREVQKGILLHRFIDDYTDQHVLVMELKQKLHPSLGKFAGVALDVLFDHVLSLRWQDYSKEPRIEWIQRSYSLLSERKHEMTEKRQFILSKMIEHDWMSMYHTAEGTSRILEQMSRRISIENPLNRALEAFLMHEKHIISTFDEFFPEILAAAQMKLDTFAP